MTKPAAPDPRLIPARPDLAAAHLKDTVTADRYAEGRPFRVMIDRIAMRVTPDASKAFDTVLLFGEQITVYETKGPWAWGQSALDGYVGYVPLQSLAPFDAFQPTHRIATLFAQVYAQPQLKSPPVSALPFGARVSVQGTQDGYANLQSDGWIAVQHLADLAEPAKDWVAVAEMFLGVPYVWGGRSSSGLDCSALVQLSLQSASITCPRDSDMQEQALGETLAEKAKLRRGDLIFWKGHVGIMTGPKTLLHANAHHRAVTLEPLAEAVRRIDTAGDGAITRRARL